MKIKIEKAFEELLNQLSRKKKIILLISLFFILGGMLCLTSCQWWKNYPSDNIAEEIVEEIIESKTGMDIDLSPFSPEKNERPW